MLSTLPTEILVEIIKAASLRSTSLYVLNQHTYSKALLASLCLVCHGFYDLAAPLLYLEIIVYIDVKISPLIRNLLPLLSLSQRLQLSSEAMTDEELEFTPLQHNERIANPLWVHHLSILSLGSPGPREEITTWRYFEEAVSGMKNLRSVVWEPSGGSSRLVETLASFPKLTHVSCISSSALCSPGLPQNVRLKSFIVFDCGRNRASGNIQNFYLSRDSLETLQLSFVNSVPAENNAYVTAILQGVESLPKLKYLRLGWSGPFRLTSVLWPQWPISGANLPGGSAVYVIGALQKVIDFTMLKTLQFVSHSIFHGLPQALLKGGGLPALEKLSAVLVPSQAVAIIGLCRGLNEIHIAYSRGLDPEPLRKPAERIVEAVGKHGKTLKALSLFTGYDPWIVRCNGTAFGTPELNKLINECSELEDLRVNINLDDFVCSSALSHATYSSLHIQELKIIQIPISRILPHLHHLTNLSLDLTSSVLATYTLPGTETLIPLSKPWYYPGEVTSPPSQLSEIEHALYYILSASTAYHPTPWRSHSKLTQVYISSRGINPLWLEETYWQYYVIRELLEPPSTVEAGAVMRPFFNPYVAPPGQRFLFQNNTTKIEVELVHGNPCVDDSWDSRVSRWTTAFKPASWSSSWERPMM